MFLQPLANKNETVISPIALLKKSSTHEKRARTAKSSESLRNTEHSRTDYPTSEKCCKVFSNIAICQAVEIRRDSVIQQHKRTSIHVC
jgi:hypothetical protein